MIEYYVPNLTSPTDNVGQDSGHVKPSEFIYFILFLSI